MIGCAVGGLWVVAGRWGGRPCRWWQVPGWGMCAGGGVSGYGWLRCAAGSVLTCCGVTLTLILTLTNPNQSRGPQNRDRKPQNQKETGPSPGSISRVRGTGCSLVVLERAVVGVDAAHGRCARGRLALGRQSATVASVGSTRRRRIPSRWRVPES